MRRCVEVDVNDEDGASTTTPSTVANGEWHAKDATDAGGAIAAAAEEGEVAAAATAVAIPSSSLGRGGGAGGEGEGEGVGEGG